MSLEKVNSSTEEKPEDGERKRSIEEVGETENTDALRVKQQKTDEHSHSPITLVGSPSRNLADDAKPAEESIENHMNTVREEKAANDFTAAEPASCEQSKNQKKTYRLIIYIDKLRAKPRPRSKKFSFLPQFESRVQDHSMAEVKAIARGPRYKDNERSPCIGGCVRQESVSGADSSFQCRRCNNYCVTNENESPAKMDSSLLNSQSPFLPRLSSPCIIKTHFTCDVCETECPSRVTYDKHVRLHVSTDPLFPYKCHKCAEVFEAKEDARQHCFIVHPVIKLQNTVLQMAASPLTPQTPRQKDYRCISCNITFRNEQAFRNHINSHTRKEGLRCGISDANNIIPVPNPLTGSQIGILRAIKFTCRVCSKEFDNVGEVDKHTRTHLADAEEEHKCNICNKTFRSNVQLNEHVKHHFSCAHHCPVCSKTFVNKTTLKAHLKMHAENKVTLMT